MSNTERFSAEIVVNSKQAQRNLDLLIEDQKRLQKLQKEYSEKGMKDQVLKIQKELEHLGEAIKKEESYVKGLKDSVRNLSGLTYRELSATLKALNKELRSNHIEQGSEEWENLTKKIRECKTEMMKFSEATRLPEHPLKRLFRVLNDNWGAFTQLLGAITGLSMTIRKAVNDYAEMEQEMANVRKYTGQTADQVEKMNEDFKRMDTRTAREELNQLAGAAGRLGIESTDKIEEFVDAADKIGVALGDDLGKDAVDTIGKLAIAFGESDRLGLRGAMLATGSALNDIVQNSSAQAQPVVEFTKALSGVGQQAHMTQAQIMGYASALDQNNQEMATSSTVMSQLITKMYQDPAKFASMAGLEVKEFAKLVKTDMNEALVQWFEAANKLGDMSVLAGAFDKLGMDGTRAVGVLATLAGHIDQVTEAQRVATEAYEKATSVTDEFNVQNSTVQAEMDKVKKRFKDLTVELGERLMPVVKYTISGTSLLVKGLSIVTEWFLKYKGEIIATTVALSAYMLVAKADTVWAKLASGLKIVTSGFKSLFSTLKANPWAIVATGVALVAEKLYEMKKRSDELKESAREIEKVEREASKSFHEQAATVKALEKIIRSEVTSIDEKKEALDRLKEIIPDYHALLDEEGRLTRDNKEAIDDYLISLEKEIKLKAYKDKLEELYSKQSDLEDTRKEQSDRYWDVRQTNTLQGYDRNSLPAKILRLLGAEDESALKEALDDTDDAITDVNGKIDQLLNKIAEVDDGTSKIVKKKTKVTSVTPGSYKTEKEKKKEEAEERKALKDHVDTAKASYQEQLAEEMRSYRQGITTYRDYMEEKHNLVQNYYDGLKAIYGEDSNEYKKLLDDREKEEYDYYQWREKLDEDKIVLERMQRDHAIQMQFLDKTNAETYQNQELLNENLFKSEMAYMKQRQALYNNGSKEWEEWEQKMKDAELQHKFELEENYQKKLLEYRREFSLMTAKELEDIELQSVKIMYETLIAEGKMTEEEYRKIVQNIKGAYAEMAAEQTADSSLRNKGSKALDTARKKSGVLDSEGGNDIVSIIGNAKNAIDQQKVVNDELRRMYEQGAIDYETYEQAKRQNARETADIMMASASGALGEINQMLASVSSYMQACSDVETEKIKKNYEAQIEAAGKNSKKREKLEKQRDEEIQKAKTKANKKAMAIEMAQAVASTAMAAINAYASAAKIPVTGWVMAPVAAGMATAAGMLQIATIKKQHQAEEAGYYSGGFTGGKNYRKEAGVVHEGEFVANHDAVNNKRISPIFDLLDKAQRNNMVGSLTPEDVTNVMGGPASAAVVPIVNVQTDNEQIRENLDAVSDAVQHLSEVLSEPIEAKMSMQHLDKEWKKYQNLLKSK